MNLFGLIGYPLTHSFSKGYFTEKFQNLGIADTHGYEKFEMQNIEDFSELIQNNPDLRGLNVTIPHKQNVIGFLDEIEDSAKKIGAVNVVKVLPDNRLKGYNSDYYGFKNSLEEWFVTPDRDLPSDVLNPVRGLSAKALVLGDGGAARAIKVALEDLGIEFKVVARRRITDETILFEELTEEIIKTHQLIINTTPLGTFPKVEECPEIPYQFLTENHYLYDLIYNPAETLFMKKGLEKGAKAMNGLRMLHLQAEKSWEIWNE
ncbi:MAG: shikimate dehydrogenase [Spirosomaceae bacterium]|jgi:shikimate dehydrogenase|nr:shikimate dehydrogenase [Spirosomataceae bacterium]